VCGERVDGMHTTARQFSGVGVNPTKSAISGMRHRMKALIGVAAVAVVAFIFLAPAFYWFTQDNPSGGSIAVGHQPLYTAYRSLGCMVFGYGDAYYTGLVTFVNGQGSINGQGGYYTWTTITQGLVFTCQTPMPVA
jgi:hypothetical protein